MLRDDLEGFIRGIAKLDDHERAEGRIENRHGA
jgi:hypothetical protein